MAIWAMIGQMIGGMSKGGGSGGKSPQYNPTGDLEPTTGQGVIGNELGMQGNYLKSQDRGFYGHMTTGKAKKGKKINIIGRGC